MSSTSTVYFIDFQTICFMEFSAIYESTVIQMQPKLDKLL